MSSTVSTLYPTPEGDIIDQKIQMTRKTILIMFSLFFFNFGTRRGKFIFSDPVIKTDDKWEIKKRQLDYSVGTFPSKSTDV